MVPPSRALARDETGLNEVGDDPLSCSFCDPDRFADGQTTADSAPTEVIEKAAAPTTTTTTTTTIVTTTPPPPVSPAVNHRPTITILSVRFAGARVYARFRL
jgi:hypothetical protein